MRTRRRWISWCGVVWLESGYRIARERIGLVAYRPAKMGGGGLLRPGVGRRVGAPGEPCGEKGTGALGEGRRRRTGVVVVSGGGDVHPLTESKFWVGDTED
ncbi:hypothetical protein ZWY2020_015427 [Hordeum vulgare]|nr:hypothetical protein ZWY2020_015427 [Hordeum vulgare]